MDKAQRGQVQGDQRWKLRLYISGPEADSMEALSNLTRICEAYIPESYTIEVIDVAGKPALVKKDEVVFTPTLLRMQPLPVKKLSGPLDDRDLVLAVLGLGPYH